MTSHFSSDGGLNRPVDGIKMDIQTTLHRLRELLKNHSGDSAAWIGSVIELGGSDETGFYRLLNSNRMWGGAGSIANEALADNPGIDEWLWQAEIRELRELMIELGKQLQARGNEYPDISSWLLAFSNWNQSEV
jgi:hypothetical protein